MDPLPPGPQFGDYQARPDSEGKPVVLGKGGFGLTIQGYRTRLLGGQEVIDECVIKVLRKERTKSPRRQADFIQEIQALRKLRHPNLVEYIDCGELEDGTTYLVLEHCRGGDLDALIRRRVGPLPERLALKVILQVAEGLAEVHRGGFVHRDIKPKNILLDEQLPETVTLDWLEQQIDCGALRFKLTDFGLVMNFANQEEHDRGFTGTRMFASPEQIRRDCVDARSDIYSLGLALWFVVNGGGPLIGPTRESESVTEEQAMSRHVNFVEHDSEFPRDWSPEFRKLLARMVRKYPDERFGGVQEVIAAARQVLAMLPGVVDERDGQSGIESVSNPFQTEMLGTWGQAPEGSLIADAAIAGTRPLGEGNARLYTARWTPTGKEVRLTVWRAVGALDDPAERDFGSYLCNLGKAANSPVAPAEILPVTAVLRTADDWWIAEPREEGEPLDEFLIYLNRPMKPREAVRFLLPLARACDYLIEAGFDWAEFSAWSIHIVEPRPWDAWRSNAGEMPPRCQFSAVGLPPQWAYRIERDEFEIGAAGDGPVDDPNLRQLSLLRSFCRVFYRVVKKGEASSAAMIYGRDALSKTLSLSDRSDALLANCMANTGREVLAGAVDLLTRICQNEGILSWKPEVKFGRAAGPSRTQRLLE